MIIIISPAKSLDYLRQVPDHQLSLPQFMTQTNNLHQVVKKLKPQDLQDLMSISPALAQLNWTRNQQFNGDYQIQHLASELNPKLASQTIAQRAAIYSFTGDVYQGLDAPSLSNTEIDYAQQHLRILSGFYGILRPLDSLQPYRLEMGTKLAVNKTTPNLYTFWKELVTAEFNRLLEGQDFLLNLASKEYSSVIDFKKLNKPSYEVVFLDNKNGVYKNISFFAKKARGLMARYLIQNNANSIEQVKQFNLEGYYFDSIKDNILTFKREQQ